MVQLILSVAWSNMLPWRQKGLDTRNTLRDTRNPPKQEMSEETLSCLDMAIPGLACQHWKGAINDT